MATPLQQQRDRIIARHRVLEGVPGSGWHARDANLASERNEDEERGHAHQKPSERLVAFVCDEEVVLVGDCVGRAVAGLQAFNKAVADDPTYSNTARADRQMAQTIDRVAAFCARPAPTDELRVPAGVWNSYTHALGMVGIRCILTEGLLHDTPKQVRNHA